MKDRIQSVLLIGVALLLALNLLVTIIDGPKLVKADSKAQYKVVFSNKTKLEKTLNDMTSNGWEFVHSEMAMDVVIFKK
ncbi:MAG: hypothetical protein H8E00_01070 [Deltaproteobacteria bacterium]|nr:hypothetical protein [Deltaproteobacteria bacterium]